MVLDEETQDIVNLREFEQRTKLRGSTTDKLAGASVQPIVAGSKGEPEKRKAENDAEGEGRSIRGEKRARL